MNHMHLPALLLSAIVAVPAFAETTLPPVHVEQTLELQRDESLSAALIRAGLTEQQAYGTLAPLQKKVSLKKLPSGMELTVFYENALSRLTKPTPSQISFFTPDDKSVSISRTEKGDYAATVNAREVQKSHGVAVGRIEDSLYQSFENADIPVALVKPFVDLFSWEIDFTREIQPGDTFRITYDQVLDADGNVLRTGRILAAELFAEGKPRQAFYAEYQPGKFGYFDAKGNSKERALLRTPLEVYRISSGFNLKRRHPVLGYTRAHRGTDFAAPTGTPIKASGEGKVVEMGWKGGYGRYMRIDHGNGFQTAYAHMHAFAKGVRQGLRVKQGQKIAYVGSTGLSSGPHLHYEVIKKGAKVNPMTVVLPNKSLPKNMLAKFKAQINTYLAQWDKAAPTNVRVAQAK